MRLERPSLWFLPVLVLTVVTALFLAWRGPVREAAAIILFIPLIWAYMSQPFPVMAACAVFLAVVRVTIEAEQLYVKSGDLNIPRALAESAFPIGLYPMLGLAFYYYRRRHHALTEKLVLASAKETFADLSSRVAHDLNNVFTVIQGTAELMRSDHSLSPAVAADVRSIQTAALQGIELVSDLRSMQRPQPDAPTLGELSEIVDGQVALIQRILPETIQVQRELSAEPLMVHLSPSQFGRVLTNLCLNARDAMPAGGLLTIRTERRRVNGHEWAALSICDTGIGMDERTLRRVFEPFFTTRFAQGGTGLGLSICRTIVTAHGGYIEVGSRLGEGTTFTVLLPLANHQPAAKPAEASVALFK